MTLTETLAAFLLVVFIVLVLAFALSERRHRD